ncbi:hypothetical protein EZV77_08630 [Burkholderia thailandensis]|nr:hypothetical protein EZV77_08630 [Burkholderia thailandensis]TGB34029.1 hypothetical protein C6946_08895 [Burkholderia thailandensis]
MADLPVAPFCFRRLDCLRRSVSRRLRDCATQRVTRRFGDETRALGRILRDLAVASNLSHR